MQSNRAQAVGLSGRGGRVSRGSAVLLPKAGGGRSEERMWGGIIPILATECTEGIEKCKKALRTLRPLRFKYHMNFMF